MFYYLFTHYLKYKTLLCTIHSINHSFSEGTTIASWTTIEQGTSWSSITHPSGFLCGWPHCTVTQIAFLTMFLATVLHYIFTSSQSTRNCFSAQKNWVIYEPNPPLRILSHSAFISTHHSSLFLPSFVIFLLIYHSNVPLISSSLTFFCFIFFLSRSFTGSVSVTSSRGQATESYLYHVSLYNC